MSERNLRIERKVSSSTQVETITLRNAIATSKKGVVFSYDREVPVFLKETAQKAEKFGQALCAQADCELECVGIDLLDTITPQTNIDGILTARCSNATCDAVAVVEATHVFFQGALDQL